MNGAEALRGDAGAIIVIIIIVIVLGHHVI
jgi:hypothetical protein